MSLGSISAPAPAPALATQGTSITRLENVPHLGRPLEHLLCYISALRHLSAGTLYLIQIINSDLTSSNWSCATISDEVLGTHLGRILSSFRLANHKLIRQWFATICCCQLMYVCT